MFHLLFHFYLSSFISLPLLFHTCFVHLVSYIYFSFTLSSEAAHLTPSSCSTMMIPSLFLPLCTINTWDVVDCKLTYSWESTFYFSFHSQTLPVSNNCTKAQTWTRLLTVETSTVSWSPNNSHEGIYCIFIVTILVYTTRENQFSQNALQKIVQKSPDKSCDHSHQKGWP